MIKGVILGEMPVLIVLDVCVRSQGYWRNHKNWPVSELTLGTSNYDQGELLAILREPVRGNGLTSLARQLIAAKLNQARGAAVPPEVCRAMVDADAVIGSLVVPPHGTSFLHPSLVDKLSGILDEYNNGQDCKE